MGLLDVEIKDTGKIKEIVKNYTGEILFGVPSSTSKVRPAETDENRGKVSQLPYNNAEILALMEHGSVVNNIPARPLLKAVIEKYKDTISDKLQEICLLLYYNNVKQADIEMEKLALRIEGWAKKFFLDEDNGWAPNAPITIKGGWMRRKNIDGTYGKPFYVKGKGSDRPLIDTGALRKSIKAIYYKEGRK